MPRSISAPDPRRQRQHHRGWRQLPLADLETLILQFRREAARQHKTTAEWRYVDRMRKRAAALQKDQPRLV
jgi:hypothetical protein